MEIVDNPSLSRLILDHLADLYKLRETRQGVHLSTLVYCLTRSWLDSQSGADPTDEEVMLFSLGLGLQDVLTPKQASSPVYELDGIVFSPDMVFESNQQLVELKTTRMSTKRPFPETWIEYIKGGCYMRKVQSYDLAILYMLGNYAPPFPQIRSFSIQFSEFELKSNWDYLLDRKLVYDEAVVTKQIPIPYKYCKDWECEKCRHKLVCQAVTSLAKTE